MATPATGHVGGTVSHLWQHLRPITDARYANAVSGTDKAKDADKLDGMNSTSFWGSSNDGSSSGLDADLLDGLDASAFADAGHSHDDRYFTEAEADARFVPMSRQGAAKIAYGEMPPGGHILVGTLESDIALISITAPADGFLLMTSQAAWSNNSAGTYLTMRLRDNADTLWDEWLWDPGDVDGFYDMHPTRTSLFPVTAGIHTYWLKATMSSGSADVARTNLVAVFIPGSL